MSSTLCSALGIDKEDLAGQMLAVEEIQGSDANFILSCIMVERLQKDGGICLVALHNSFGHYHNVIMKLSGYNLCQLSEKGFVETVEPMKMVSNDLSGSGGEGDFLRFCSGDRECLVRDLFLMIKTKVEKLMKIKSTVCVVIDDLSDLLSVGISLKDVFSFLHYCRTLLVTFPGLSLVILSHVFELNEKQCLLTAGLAHSADIIVTVSGLKTGRCSDVSGNLKVKHKTKEPTELQQWNLQTCYHFKLQDRQVKMFAPGTYTSLS